MSSVKEREAFWCGYVLRLVLWKPCVVFRMWEVLANYFSSRPRARATKGFLFTHLIRALFAKQGFFFPPSLFFSDCLKFTRAWDGWVLYCQFECLFLVVWGWGRKKKKEGLSEAQTCSFQFSPLYSTFRFQHRKLPLNQIYVLKWCKSRWTGILTTIHLRNSTVIQIVISNWCIRFPRLWSWIRWLNCLHLKCIQLCFAHFRVVG